MNDFLFFVHFRFKEMPLLLKYLFFPISLLGILFAVSSLIPFGQFEIDGRAASYYEWWSSGGGLWFTVMVLLFQEKHAELFRVESSRRGRTTASRGREGSRWPMQNVYDFL